MPEHAATWKYGTRQSLGLSVTLIAVQPGRSVIVWPEFSASAKSPGSIPTTFTVYRTLTIANGFSLWNVPLQSKQPITSNIMISSRMSETPGGFRPIGSSYKPNGTQFGLDPGFCSLSG
jgi:hypothetical protein